MQRKVLEAHLLTRCNLSYRFQFFGMNGGDLSGLNGM